ncbi:YafY family transcriptional regulator [Pseudoalteromonas sp. McH1-7]|uniref:helix-turn-helix transcriptional regulator n=1 Tax=Pseudoalteromonas TaxID=53246 RepID=UPI00159030AE|nr:MULTISPECIES: YafY family protein [Pseudoalteromonas]MDW7547687.1 YafY family protein [Pseudoalteromonas peptidolytica]NUZ11264.1 YafY family transcriptional regulator [Pseudoalteromonas sp. McH1-7]USD27688.1 YafY family transcriptional regulator [Pseudoalteromonas sp. SCSIO 43201]
MHKSERLFQLVNLLKGRRLAVTAKSLAAHFSVSERTIYRDIQDLQSSGVPIEGEAGIGYVIADYPLPPMMFSYDELTALLLGSKMVSAWTDPELSAHAKSAISKIEAVLPAHLKQQHEHSPYLVSSFKHGPQQQSFSAKLRAAIETQRCVTLDYKDALQQHSQRVIEPLGLVYWGGKWTLIAFCQLRSDYREFRLDRITAINKNELTYAVSPDKNLNHYVELVKAKYAEEIAQHQGQAPDKSGQ